MKIRRFIIALLTFTLTLFGLFAIEESDELRFVTADVGLRMRIAPDLSQRKLETIPFNEPVILIEESGDELTIAGATGRWSKVNWRGLEGWVFGGFLAKEFVLPANFIFPANAASLLWGDGFWLEIGESRTWYFVFEDNRCTFGYYSSSAIVTGTPRFDSSSKRLVISGEGSLPDGEEFDFSRTFTVLYIKRDLLILRDEDYKDEKTGKQKIIKLVRMKKSW